MWLAPNLITLLGLSWVMAAFVLDAVYIMDYTGACHARPDCSWVWAN